MPTANQGPCPADTIYSPRTQHHTDNTRGGIEYGMLCETMEVWGGSAFSKCLEVGTDNVVCGHGERLWARGATPSPWNLGGGGGGAGIKCISTSQCREQFLYSAEIL